MSLRLNPRHRMLTGICLFFTGSIAISYHWSAFHRQLESKSRDWLMTNALAEQADQDAQIIFLGIDEKTRTMETVYPEDYEKSSTLRLMKNGFPWNRQVYGDIIDRLAGAGAKVIAFDMLFPSPRDGDAGFQAALLRHGDRTVIGANLVNGGQDDNATQTNLFNYIVPARALLPPPGRPSWLGFVNVRPDEDGLVRRVSYRTTREEYSGIPAGDDSTELLSLPARALEKAGYADRIPRTHEKLMLRYASEFKARSLHEIFVEDQWNAPPYNRGALFKGKIVLIGATEQASEDRLQTPAGALVGAQIHLSAINAALHDYFIKPTPAAIDGALIFLGGFAAWFLGMRVRRRMHRLATLALLVGGYYGGVQALANHYGIIAIYLSPLLALTGSGLAWSVWEQVLDGRERRRTRQTLERYVSKDVVREVLDNPTSYLNSLGGERKDITVLFSDVRGFTTLTESTDPHRLVTQLNEYFEAMVAIVFEHHGTLDKFIGDAVMAHWGSIVSAGPAIDAERAINTVLEMRRVLATLNTGWKPRGFPEMRVGFGLNHGEAIVGNLGCEAKMEVSVIGDAVNLGSRLEGATKAFHLDLCVGENVANLVRDRFILRSVDFLIVQGKTKPVEIFTVLDRADALVPTWLPHHEEAVRLYRAGDFASAEKAWREVLAEAPGEGLSEVMLARCVRLQADPPTEPWTGVYAMTSK